MLLWSELLLVTKSVQGAGDFEERFCCASCTSKRGDQFATAYREINPQMVVPTLIDGDIKLFQSLAILEYLEEKFPEPPLLPADAEARA